RGGLRFRRGLRELHPACFAATADVHLGLHHDRESERRRGGLRFGGRRRHTTFGNGDAGPREHLFGLEFVELHGPRTLSFPLILWRLFLRTNRRIFRREVLWNGNRERFANAYLSTDSLYLWVFRSFWRRRRNWPRWLAEDYRHLAVHRFRTPGEADRWLASL